MDSSRQQPGRRGKRALKIGLLILLCAGTLGAIVGVVGVDETAKALKQAGFLAFGAMGLLAVLIIAIQARAWARLNRPIGHRVPFSTLMSGVTLGMAVNIVTPSSYLGGEPIKVLYVRKRTGLPVGELTGTVVLGKYLEAISFLLLFGVCTAVAALVFSKVLFQGPYLSAGVALLTLAAALLLLGAVLWLALSREWRPLTFLVRLGCRLRPRSAFLARLLVHTGEMEHQVSRVARANTGQALTAFGLYLLSQVVILLKPALFFLLGAGMGLGIGELCLVFAATQALLALQLTPSGVGTLDGGMIGTFALLGLSEAHAMAFLLCIRFWDAVNVGTGAVLAARVGARLFNDHRPTPPESPAGSVHGPAL